MPASLTTLPDGLTRGALLLGAEPAVLVRVEAAERHHAALETHAHHELLGGALLAAGEAAVAVVIELLDQTLAHLAPGSSLIGNCSGRCAAEDERDGENDSLHVLVDPRPRRKVNCRAR